MYSKEEIEKKVEVIVVKIIKYFDFYYILPYVVIKPHILLILLVVPHTTGLHEKDSCKIITIFYDRLKRICDVLEKKCFVYIKREEEHYYGQNN